MSEDRVKVPQSCILFATADWDEPYWTNKQHCAKSLAELGTNVLYVESVGIRNPKAGSAKDWKRLMNRLRKGLSSLLFGAKERSPRVFVLSPLLVPAGHRYQLTRWLNRWLLKIAINRSIRQRDFNNPLIWTYHPFILDVFAGIDSCGLLYHCVDDLAALPGVDKNGFRRAEAQLLKQADVVFTTAKPLAEFCKTINPNTYFYPNVVDISHFGKALDSSIPIPLDIETIPEPRLVYHGVLSDFKVDFQLLLECAKLKPNWSWVLIGEEREGQKSPILQKLSELPNVYILGYRAYDILPDYLRGMQVGLLPSQLNDYTKGMFPMKYFEYLAAGLPIVSTNLSFTATVSKSLCIANSTEEFIKKIGEQLVAGKFSQVKAQKLIGENTWQCRTKKMLSAIQYGQKVSL